MDEKQREYFRHYWQTRRKEYLELLGGQCVKCGSKHDLEFDHVDPSIKSFHINSKLTYKKQIILEELAKCQLLCRDCHQVKTTKENQGFTHATYYAVFRARCTCQVCQHWKDNVYYPERNAKRRMSEGPRGPYNEPAGHGTYKRYKRGCKCQPCKDANAQYIRELRQNK